MALVNGSEYDHIDLHSVAGGDVTRHMLKDAKARADIAGMSTATAEDVGKALKPKTVTNGKVTEWEFGEVGVQVDDTLTQVGKAADAKKTGDEISDLKSAIDEITVPKLTQISGETITGKFINAAGAVVDATSGASQWEVTDYVDVTEWSQVAITASAFTSRMYYGFYDANHTYISGSGKPYVSGTVLRDEIVDVPANAVYCVAMWYYTTSANDPIIKGVGLKPDPAGMVQYDTVQTLTDAQKEQARQNIGAANNEVTTTVQNIVQLKDIPFYTDYCFIAVSNGAKVGDTSNRYKSTNYINIAPFREITFPQYYSGANAGMAFYDRDFNFTHSSALSGSIGSPITIQVQSSDVYARFCCTVANVERFYINTDFYLSNALNKVENIIENDRNDDSLFSEIIRDGGFTRIFDKIGVVGDSLSSGAMVYGAQPGQSVDMHYYSWIQDLARACGTTAYNFSQSGLSTRGFLNDLGGWKTKMLNPDYKCKAYFIALAHNDSAQEIPVGEPSDIDVSDPSQSADTFYGDYAKIIGLIKGVQPNAKIFCICSKLSGFAAYNVAIRYMETVFDNVYTLDMETYYPTLESWWEYTNGHGNAMGYLNYSWQIGTYVDWIIRHNKTDFKYVQFIGTDWDEYIPSDS